MPSLTLTEKCQEVYRTQRAKKQYPTRYFLPLRYQRPFFTSKKKNKAIFGGNRSGKTICGTVDLIEDCLNNAGFDTWACTWADLSIPIQQKSIWNYLPKLQRYIEYASFSEQRGFANRCIIFRNGSMIRFKTYDQGWESFQGASKDKIWLDEEPPEEVLNECKARLIDRSGTLIRTLTPLNGITYTYDEIIENENNDQEVAYWYFLTQFNTHIDLEAFKRIINSYSSKEAEVRSTGHFINLTSGQVYYSFSQTNIIKESNFQYMVNRPLEISCDFNVDLMSWNISQEHQGKDYIFDYVELEGQANTQVMCDMIKNKFSGHDGGYIFYGDISGSQRRPETSKTNWTIISENFPNAKIYYQNIKNIKDRTDALNGRLKNNQNEINIYITKNCTRLIRDLRQVTWTHLINKNKAKKLTHISDGLSYMIFWKYPLTGKAQTIITSNEQRKKKQKAHAIGWKR